ncbi:TPM domain-containing protein [Peptoniphilus genitalis]
MKKLLATILFAFTLVFNVYAFDKNQMSYNVYDETNTLSQETIDYLNKTTYDLKKKTGGEIGVVLVKSLEGNSLEEYATKIFNDIGIGDKDKNNGVLILLALLDDNNKLVKIEPGYGAEGFIPPREKRVSKSFLSPLSSLDEFKFFNIYSTLSSPLLFV